MPNLFLSCLMIIILSVEKDFNIIFSLPPFLIIIFLIALYYVILTFNQKNIPHGKKCEDPRMVS